jgi:hypothetical protein
MMQFVQAVPQAAAVCGDLIAEAQDWPKAEAIAERLKKMLPPQLQGDPQTKKRWPSASSRCRRSRQQMQQQQRRWTPTRAEEGAGGQGNGRGRTGAVPTRFGKPDSSIR